MTLRLAIVTPLLNNRAGGSVFWTIVFLASRIAQLLDELSLFFLLFYFYFYRYFFKIVLGLRLRGVGRVGYLVTAG